MGTGRLAFVFVAGFIGILYLILSISSLVTGRVELGATEVSIDTIESEGFPDAEYLKVTGGYIVFSEAYANVRSPKRGGDLFILTAPVVSEQQWREWRASLEKGEPIDASKFRLVISFMGKQVGKLWSELKKQAEAGQPLKMEDVQMTVIGDTEPAVRQLNRPMRSEVKKVNLDWEKARWMRYKRHLHGPGRVIKNLAIGIALLAAAIAMWRHHRRMPDDVTVNELDITPLFDE